MVRRSFQKAMGPKEDADGIQFCGAVLRPRKVL